MRQGLPAAGPEPAAAVAIGGTFPQPAVVLFGDKRPEALLRRPPRNRVQRATAAQRIVVFLTQIPRRVPPRTARDAADARPGGCRHPGGCGFVRERGRWAASAAGNPAPGPPPRPAPASAPPAARWRISRPRRSRRAAARTARSAPGRPATALAGTRGAADAGTTAPMAADPPDVTAAADVYAAGVIAPRQDVRALAAPVATAASVELAVGLQQLGRAVPGGPDGAPALGGTAGSDAHEEG